MNKHASGKFSKHPEKGPRIPRSQPKIHKNRISVRNFFALLTVSFVSALVGCGHAHKNIQGGSDPVVDEGRPIHREMEMRLAERNRDTSIHLSDQKSAHDFMMHLIAFSSRRYFDLKGIEEAISKPLYLRAAGQGDRIYVADLFNSPISSVTVYESTKGKNSPSFAVFLNMNESFRFNGRDGGGAAECLLTRDFSAAMADEWTSNLIDHPFRITYRSKLLEKVLLESTPAHTDQITRCVKTISVYWNI